jgi:hypothetical protein
LAAGTSRSTWPRNASKEEEEEEEEEEPVPAAARGGRTQTVAQEITCMGGPFSGTPQVQLTANGGWVGHKEPAMEFEDKVIVCSDCGKEFPHTAEDQKRYAERGFSSDPKR